MLYLNSIFKLPFLKFIICGLTNFNRDPLIYMYHFLHFCPKHFQPFLENYITVSKYNYTGTIVHYLGPKDWIMAHSYLLCENKYGTLTLRSCHRRDAWQGHDGLYYLISWPDNLWISTTNTTNFICQLERSHFYLSCKNIYPTLTLRSRHGRDAWHGQDWLYTWYPDHITYESVLQTQQTLYTN